jgi:hypothetical protein
MDWARDPRAPRGLKTIGSDWAPAAAAAAGAGVPGGGARALMASAAGPRVSPSAQPASLRSTRRRSNADVFPPDARALPLSHREGGLEALGPPMISRIGRQQGADLELT